MQDNKQNLEAYQVYDLMGDVEVDQLSVQMQNTTRNIQGQIAKESRRYEMPYGNLQYV